MKMVVFHSDNKESTVRSAGVLTLFRVMEDYVAHGNTTEILDVIWDPPQTLGSVADEACLWDYHLMQRGEDIYEAAKNTGRITVHTLAKKHRSSQHEPKTRT